jgi:hypothetical protein
MRKVFLGCCLLSCLFSQAQEINKIGLAKMTPLFNGNDLNGWYSFLATKGKDNDPEKVFNVEKGMLHISGKEFGYICTNKTYRNFHLAAEFKWGTKKWPPRDADTTKRDNGICFYFPVGIKDTVWPKSIECQIQEGDVGDIWLIDSTTVIVDGKRTEPMDFMRAQKKTDAERKTGRWNRVEVIADNGNLTYIVNGTVVNTATSPSVLLTTNLPRIQLSVFLNTSS